MSTTDWQLVATFGAAWEAEMAQGRLASAGIPSRIDQRGSVGVFGPSYQGKTVRGVALLVPTDRADEAREALDLDET
ncbi:MAG: DUF2007 domain-containing protein [Gemmatimonadales bacterium]|jgi:hypothetical protein